jgi:2-dehydropantoate 2-reductase
MSRVAVVGAGGMGSAVAAYLAAAHTSVVLVGRSPAHIEAITQQGLRVDSPDGSSRTVRVEATTAPATVAPAQHVIVLTKTFDTRDAARAAAAVAAPGAWITTLQNGLGNDAVLAETFGPDHVLPGTTTIGAERHEPGRITLSAATAGGRCLTHIGPPRVPDGPLAGASELAELMTGAGLPAVATYAIDDAIWTKLALAVMGPFSAIVGAMVIDTWQQPDAPPLLERLHDEVVAVAIAEGVPLDRDESWKTAMATYEATGRHFTSMATDIRQGRRTEIDSITGEVVRRAHLHDIPVPVAETVVGLLRISEGARVRD